jgi:hypothetical protein
LLVEEATPDVLLPVFSDVPLGAGVSFAEPVAAALLLAGEAPVAVPEGEEASTVRWAPCAVYRVLGWWIEMRRSDFQMFQVRMERTYSSV